MTKEAMTLALEALEASARNWPSDSIIEAITAIKEALAVDNQQLTPEPQQNAEHVSNEQVKPFGYWYVDDEIFAYRGSGFIKGSEKPKFAVSITPLYTTPPQRTAAKGEDTRRAWVGLTDEEVNKLVDYTEYEDYYGLVEATEAKLKEKNT